MALSQYVQVLAANLVCFSLRHVPMASTRLEGLRFLEQSVPFVHDSIKLQVWVTGLAASLSLSLSL